ncbi:MAG: TM2 domain-containing protein [Flavobacteriaceae bacterium]|nr:MAG: TM2 domain-containing protein [Flavobacteriaceae bacterium]
MSEENKDPEDKAEGAFEKAKKTAKEAKEKAKETAKEAKEKAKEFADDTKEATHEFKEEAKKTAEEFTEGMKEVTETENKKILAGILGIVLGAFGVHKFILGYQKEGFILLGITIVGFVLSCIGIGVFMVWISGMIGLIEGIIYLTKTDEDFYNTYQVGKKPWF